MNLQMEARLRETLEHQKNGDLTSAAGGKSAGDPNHLEATLQQLLTAARTQASRLAKMESSCLGSSGAGTGMNTKSAFHLRGDDPTGHSEQEVTSGEAALDDVLAALQVVKGELEELKSSRQTSLPAGKTSILLSAVCLSSCFVSFTLYLFFIQSFLFLAFLQLTNSGQVSRKLSHRVFRVLLLIQLEMTEPIHILPVSLGRNNLFFSNQNH